MGSFWEAFAPVDMAAVSLLGRDVEISMEKQQRVRA